LKRVLPRLVLCAATGVALVLILGVFAPWWMGSDRSLPSAVGLVYHELQRGEALSSRDEAVRRSREAKDRITAELLAGRMTLREAAQAFQEWNETLKDGNDSWAGVYLVPGDEEAACRNVIVWAAKATDRDPERRDAVVRRLEEELRGLHHARIWAGLSSVLLRS
jgi:hypothetical protein